MTALDTRCDFCGHKRGAHQIHDGAVKLYAGACFGSGGACQCAEFEVPKEYDHTAEAKGSDISDIDESLDKVDGDIMDQLQMVVGQRLLAKNQPEGSPTPDGVYTTGSPIVTRTAEETMEAADHILSDRRDAVSYREVNGISEPKIDVKKDDPVNHPSHYTAYPGIEVIQLTRWMTFNCGNAVKYVARAGLKDPEKEIQDLEKAIWYLQDEIKLKKGEYGTPNS